jgi:hypothetical protein
MRSRPARPFPGRAGSFSFEIEERDVRRFAQIAFGALAFASASFALIAPASAYPGISFGFSGLGYIFGDPCDYYDYYSAPPPWGLPPDYCDYPVYFEPVFIGGIWYRGPIYYRWNHGQRLFWLHGGWRADEWHGARPSIVWRELGGWNHGFRRRGPPLFGGGGFYPGHRPDGFHGHH